MSTGVQWRQWQQLGRAFSSCHFPTLKPYLNSEIVTSASWGELSVALSKIRLQNPFKDSRWLTYSAACAHGRVMANTCNQGHANSNKIQGATDVEPPLSPFPSSIPGHNRHNKSRDGKGEAALGSRSFSSERSSILSRIDDRNAGPNLCSPSVMFLSPALNLIHSQTQWYKLTTGRYQASHAAIRELDQELRPDWDMADKNPATNGAEGDQKVLVGNAGLVGWQQQHVRPREQDLRQRSPMAGPPPEVEVTDVYIPVKAFYISRSVDLKRLAAEPFLEVTSSRNNLIIRCVDRLPGAPPTSNKPGFAEVSCWHERYMVAFQYGSIVFFNFGDQEEEEALNAVRQYCTDEFRETRKDDYGVLVRPTLAEWSEGGRDQIMLRKLDTDNIRVISSILGQSIALDHYAKKVDEMVNTFSELNRGMEQTGTFTMTRKKLFQLVAAANTTLADVILRLGLLERSDAAWKDANYAQIWEYLRDDFELDERFESLDFKLNIIQHNVRFFLEILQNRKSDTLEWIIILLITGEICVSLYDILHTAGAV